MKKFLAFLVFGIIGGFIVAHIYVQGYLVLWRTLATPPEKPVEILSINNGVWIRSVSGNIYNHAVNEMYPFQPIECSTNCWKEFQEAPPNEESLYQAEDCGLHVPSTKRFVVSNSVCKNFGPAGILIIYGIDKDNNISFWQHEIDDTDPWAYFLFPIQGGLYVIFGSMTWILTVDAYKGIREWWSPKMPEDFPDN